MVKKIVYKPDLDKKWQQKWKETELYKFDINSPKPKLYLMEMLVFRLVS